MDLLIARSLPLMLNHLAIDLPLQNLVDYCSRGGFAALLSLFLQFEYHIIVLKLSLKEEYDHLHLHSSQAAALWKLWTCLSSPPVVEEAISFFDHLYRPERGRCTRGC